MGSCPNDADREPVCVVCRQGGGRRRREVSSEETTCPLEGGGRENDWESRKQGSASSFLYAGRS